MIGLYSSGTACLKGTEKLSGINWLKVSVMCMSREIAYQLVNDGGPGVLELDLCNTEFHF
jgi:hypothetical protein